MADPRSYKRGTLFALAAFSGGTCYWPNPPCKTPITVLVNGHPVPNLEIAHIRAAKPNGPRYVRNMKDDERRAWPNLIFLCKPHHTYVDKVRPQDYPIEVLEKWKAHREKGKLGQLQGLTGLTEDRLQEIIAVAFKESTEEIRRIIARLEINDSDAAILLREAARHLNLDTADELNMAARSLTPALSPGNVETLFQATGMLQKMNLSAITGGLADVVADLQVSIAELRRLQGNM